MNRYNNMDEIFKPMYMEEDETNHNTHHRNHQHSITQNSIRKNSISKKSISSNSSNLSTNISTNIPSNMSTNIPSNLPNNLPSNLQNNLPANMNSNINNLPLANNIPVVSENIDELDPISKHSESTNTNVNIENNIPSNSSNSNEVIVEKPIVTIIEPKIDEKPVINTMKITKKNFKKQRSRSLPIINFKTDKKIIIPLIPPININSLKEIDLNEILKNPQLRHDIIFDPQLQFRPNLDGERGKRKKSIIDKYWYEIFKEVQQFFKPSEYNHNHSVIGGNTMGGGRLKLIRLPNLFRSLKEILLTILPNNQDKILINEILDIDLIIQQLNYNNFEFIKLSSILYQIFKTHCAPIRDEIVNKMFEIFEKSKTNNDVNLLIQGLQKIFQILECMKLDIANHQIRLLRPVLIETAIEFEKDYYNQLINLKKFNINDSINWFRQLYLKFINENKSKGLLNNGESVKEEDLKVVLTSGIFDLLSCKKMITTFPQSLTFDHTRLILLRADIRQIIVIKLCLILFQNLVKMNNLNINLTSSANCEIIKQEILSIVTDSNGNIKWTKNITNISLQLIKNLNLEIANKSHLHNDLLNFSNNWLIKQILPNSKVYLLMEDQYFKNLMIDLLPHLNNQSKKDGILGRLVTLINFNWDVFGDYYSKVLE